MPAAFVEADDTPSPWRGVMAPIVTPMTSDGGLDDESLHRQADHLIGAGVTGLWVNGTTGEFYGLSAAQRAAAVRACVTAAGRRVPVIAHVGDGALEPAAEHARAALDAGADQLSMLAPYVIDFAPQEVADQLRALAAIARRPVVVYQMPQVARAGLSVPQIVELAAEGLVAAVKDSGADVLWTRELVSAAERNGLRVPCFTGGTAVCDLGYFVGAAGAMSSAANLVPRHLVGQYEAAVGCDWGEVRARQRRTDELLAALRLPDRLGPAGTTLIFKFLLAELGRLESDRSLLPTRPLDDGERHRLRTAALPLIEDLERSPR